MAQDEFEGSSLDALYAMVANANPAELTSVSEALREASSKINQVAEALRVYVGRVEWEGEGGDAFREWGREMINETLRLGEYSTVVGAQMAHAGQALREAQAAVPKPNGECSIDPVKEAARLKEEKGKREEAIAQLNRLSSYYRTSSAVINAEPEPNFRPMAGARRGEVFDDLISARALEEGHASAYGRRVNEPLESGVSQAGKPVDVGSVARETGTVIDSAVIPAVSENKAYPVNISSNSVTQNASSDSSPPQIRPGIPAAWNTLQRSQSSGVSRGVPGGPRGQLESPHKGGRDGVIGGMGKRSLAAPTPRIPGGAVAGEERGATGRMPGPPGGGSQTGSSAATGKQAPTRRLASHQGGQVGQLRMTDRGKSTFTPGGSGLIRADAGPSTARGRQESTDEGLLDETEAHSGRGEEAWTVGHRRTVPPVID